MFEEMEKFLNGEELSIRDIRKIISYAYGSLEDEIEGDMGRWQQWVDIVFMYNGKYYMIGYDRALTEIQENDYENSYPVEVKPVKKIVEVTEWEEVE